MPRKTQNKRKLSRAAVKRLLARYGKLELHLIAELEIHPTTYWRRMKYGWTPKDIEWFKECLADMHIYHPESDYNHD